PVPGDPVRGQPVQTLVRSLFCALGPQWGRRRSASRIYEVCRRLSGAVAGVGPKVAVGVQGDRRGAVAERPLNGGGCVMRRRAASPEVSVLADSAGDVLDPPFLFMGEW